MAAERVGTVFKVEAEFKKRFRSDSDPLDPANTVR